MATPVNQAPALDPKLPAQNYRFVAVSASGVRTPVDTGPNAHHTVTEAQTKAAALAASTGAAFVEIWPPAPPCYSNGQVL